MAASHGWEAMLGVFAWTGLAPLGAGGDPEAEACAEALIESNETHRLVLGEPDSDSGPMAMAVVNFKEEQTAGMLGEHVPSSMAITLHAETDEAQDPPRQEEVTAAWEEIHETCTGGYSSEGLGGDGAVHLEIDEYSPYGMWGLQTTTVYDPGVDYGLRGQTITGHLAHHYTGDISIRVLGLNMDEEDFEEVLEAQLSKLEEAS